MQRESIHSTFEVEAVLEVLQVLTRPVLVRAFTHGTVWSASNGTMQIVRTRTVVTRVCQDDCHGQSVDGDGWVVGVHGDVVIVLGGDEDVRVGGRQRRGGRAGA